MNQLEEVMNELEGKSKDEVQAWINKNPSKAVTFVIGQGTSQVIGFIKNSYKDADARITLFETVRDFIDREIQIEKESKNV